MISVQISIPQSSMETKETELEEAWCKKARLSGEGRGRLQGVGREGICRMQGLRREKRLQDAEIEEGRKMQAKGREEG